MCLKKLTKTDPIPHLTPQFILYGNTPTMDRTVYDLFMGSKRLDTYARITAPPIG